MKKKVLILGKTGMLGHMVCRILAEESTIDVDGTHIGDQHDQFYFDVEAGFAKLVEICAPPKRYDYFVNCIGLVTGRINEKDPTSIRKAIKINALFPHKLSSFSRERGINVIHISTDGVFSGNAEGYSEDEKHDCKDLYGITKSLGEVTDEHFLNLRCSIIGPSPLEKGGLLEWFNRQPDGSTISGYTNHIWHGVSTYQFGKLCLEIIKRDRFEGLRDESAVFHFAPNDPASKYELLCLFKKYFKKDVNIEAAASDEHIYRRVLQTKRCGLKDIFPHGMSVAEMVSELAHYISN